MKLRGRLQRGHDKESRAARRSGGFNGLSALCLWLLVLGVTGCQPGSEKWDKWKMDRAQRYERNGSLVRAAEECADIVRHSKNQSTVASALFLRGDCLIRAARFDEAEGAFSEILERFREGDPVYSQMARYRLVECYKTAGRYPSAAATLRTLLEKLDKKVERALALKDLGEVLALMGDPEAGKTLAEAASMFRSVAGDPAMDPEFRAYARDLAVQTEDWAKKKLPRPLSGKEIGGTSRNPGPTPRKLQ